MKKIFGYLKDYIKFLDKGIFFTCLIFIGAAIFCNYHFHLNRQIGGLPEAMQYAAWYGIFLCAFLFPHLLYHYHRDTGYFREKRFLFLVFLAPLLFSWKMVYDIDWDFTVASRENYYWNAVFYWPFKLAVITGVLYAVWRSGDRESSFYGLAFRNFRPRPYLLMLLIMLPLVAAASTQPDFLAFYPKMKNLGFLRVPGRGLYKLLYELSYGSDFFTIELFFRGFLVLAFVKWLGRDAILPMALFYCTIHFGKPMGECISSFFGGLILGVVTYHTRTIFGGLMVHLGIAWMMELGGYLGNEVFRF